MWDIKNEEKKQTEAHQNARADGEDAPDRPMASAFVNYYTKSRFLNFMSFFLEFYRAHMRVQKKKKPKEDIAPEPTVVEGLVDHTAHQYLADLLKKEGKDMMINSDRLIIVLRACVQSIRMIGELCQVSSLCGISSPWFCVEIEFVVDMGRCLAFFCMLALVYEEDQFVYRVFRII